MTNMRLLLRTRVGWSSIVGRPPNRPGTAYQDAGDCRGIRAASADQNLSLSEGEGLGPTQTKPAIFDAGNLFCGGIARQLR